MELVIEGGDSRIVDAVTAATTAAGLGPQTEPPDAGAWWRAGLREALDRGSLEAAPSRYEAMPPPRRTRGATRA